MAEMTIRLRCDPNTGKKDIIVSLQSDKDALPIEHEQQHKALVEKLVHGGILKESELGRIIVEREEEEKPAGAKPNANPQAQRQGLSQGE